MADKRVPHLLHPGAWFVLGILFAGLLNWIFPIGGDDLRNAEHNVSAEVMIPQVVPADATMLASLQIGAPCTPLLTNGQWDVSQSKSVVISDGTQQVLSVIGTTSPVVLGTEGNVLTCGHPFQVQATVTGIFIQFNVDRRGPEVATVPLRSSVSSEGFDYLLDPVV